MNCCYLALFSSSMFFSSFLLQSSSIFIVFIIILLFRCFFRLLNVYLFFLLRHFSTKDEAWRSLIGLLRFLFVPYCFSLTFTPSFFSFVSSLLSITDLVVHFLLHPTRRVTDPNFDSSEDSSGLSPLLSKIQLLSSLFYFYPHTRCLFSADEISPLQENHAFRQRLTSEQKKFWILLHFPTGYLSLIDCERIQCGS